MTTVSVSGISGIDNIVPVFNPDGLWKTWALSEIYMGGQGENRYVPNVDDYVIDVATDERYIVVEIDPSTLVPVLRKIQPTMIADFSDDDLLLGVGPGTQSDTYRIYIDKSVIPYTLAVDARLKVAGSMVVSAKIFKGSELKGTAEVISSFYDQSGNMLGQTIPLEIVAMPTGTNYSIKTVPVCYTAENLQDGELVTAVFYSAAGHVVSKRQLLVENTAFIRSTDTSTKYITAISLESPFLSAADPTVIEFPLNVPMRGLNLIGVVTYSDGSKLRMPVDGTKFKIFGFEQYLATIIGQKLPLVLKYTLSDGEIVYGANASGDRFMTAKYEAITTQSDGAFTVKLFGYPVWIDDAHGYRLEWYLYNLERNRVYNVTPFVNFSSNSPAFDPLSFGVVQNLNVAVNLHDVNGVYQSYIHAQTYSISLLRRAPDNTGSDWTIKFDPMQYPEYGTGLRADTVFTNQNLSKIDISCGITTQEEWLKQVYLNTKPLVDPAREIVPPTPTHFTVVMGAVETEFVLSQWSAQLDVAAAINNGGTVFVKFFKRTPEGDIQLAMAGLSVRQVN